MLKSTDTDFQPSTYPSTPGAAGGPDAGFPVFPLPSGTGLTDPSGQTVQTIPFFATDAFGTHDYDGTNANANIRDVTIPNGTDSIWVYYGCYLDVYNSANQSKFPGAHHCVVAEIAYDGAPIPAKTPAGGLVSPLSWDQLAQRNLQITTSENPQSSATHIVPQAFDLRPSNIIGAASSVIQGLPDELMIDWGNTPVGSTATIYWPQLQSADVVNLADQFYGSHFLYSADVNTLQCTTTSGVTYVPIPTFARGTVNFAGLFTVTLPTTIRNGQSFQILVRRISSVALTLPPPPPENPPLLKSRLKLTDSSQPQIRDQELQMAQTPKLLRRIRVLSVNQQLTTHARQFLHSRSRYPSRLRRSCSRLKKRFFRY